MADPKIPTDGPEAVLARVVRHLGLRFTRTYVARSVIRHPNPHSLLALVEVGRDLGVKTTAGKTDPSAIAELELPVIVHFTGPAGGGFGVLEAITSDGFKVWDSTNGSHSIARDAFLSNWTGVVVLVQRDEGPARAEKGYLKTRATEIVFGSIDPPAVVGSRAARPLRIALGILLLIALGVALAGVPAGARAASAVVTLLSLAGLGVTTLTGVSIGTQDSALSDRICARGKLVDCQSVLSSQYSRVAGIPLSDVGVALFGSIVLLIATGTVSYEGAAGWSFIGLLYLATLPFSILLVGIQISMKQLCTLCLAVHTVNFAAAAITWLWLRPGIPPASMLLAMAIIFGLFFCLLLFFAIPYFRKHQGLRVLAGMHRRISGSPFAALAEILTEAPTDLVVDATAVPLPGPIVDHQLVVFVHPSCAKCDSVFGEVNALVEAGLISAHVGLAPKDPEEVDRRMCTAVVAAGMANGRLRDAYTAAKEQLWAVMKQDPVPIIAEELSVNVGEIEATIEGARGRVDRAETFVDDHAEGTPAIFFNTRLYRGELSHLAFLLSRHPDLLAETLPASRRAVEEVPSS